MSEPKAKRRVMAKTIDFGFNESGQGGAEYQCKCGWTAWIFGDEVTKGAYVRDRYPCPKCNKEK